MQKAPEIAFHHSASSVHIFQELHLTHAHTSAIKTLVPQNNLQLTSLQVPRKLPQKSFLKEEQLYIKWWLQQPHVIFCYGWMCQSPTNNIHETNHACLWIRLKICLPPHIVQNVSALLHKIHDIRHRHGVQLSKLLTQPEKDKDSMSMWHSGLKCGVKIVQYVKQIRKVHTMNYC